MKAIAIPCQLHRDHAAQLERFLQQLVQQLPPANSSGVIALDCSHINQLDSVGAAILWQWDKHARQQGKHLQLVQLMPVLQRKLATMAIPNSINHANKTQLLSNGAAARQNSLLQDLSKTYPLLRILLKDFFWGQQWRKGRFWQRVAYEMLALGANAWLIIGTISVLVGATIALQSAAQLKMFGANLYVTDLLTISILRELGPLMAAIVLAGRSGSAIAAQVGTMVIAEEMDALHTMGISGQSFVIMPKFIGLICTQPLLTCMANSLGILGGALITIGYLDVSWSSFWERFLVSLAWKDIATGMLKSILFAVCTVLLASTAGLGTKGGPEGVGKSTTNSVVRSLFAIIATDAILSLVFYLGD